MERATRWLRTLLSGKKDAKDRMGNASSSRGEKKKWSFGKLGRSSARDLGRKPSPASAEAGWSKPLGREIGKEQSKHAIEVAVVAAAAADAAVAAAQAAAVHLKSHVRGGCKQWAAIKIQTAYRGYLARKALRALRALVRLQALVRGYLVRKQAAATLHRLQAVIRAQASAWSRNSDHRSIPAKDGRLQPEIRPRKSYESLHESRRAQWVSIYGHRRSEHLDGASYGFDRSSRIVEMDSCRPTSRSGRRTCPLAPNQAEDHLPSVSVSSPLPCLNIPSRLAMPSRRSCQGYERCLSGDRCRCSKTAQSTPRYTSSSGSNPALTPAKSLNAVDGFLRQLTSNPSRPNYMASTRSYVAKVRSASAPKQRPEPAGPRKKAHLNEIVEPRASWSGAGTRRSGSQAREALSFRSAVVDRLERCTELGRDYYHMEKIW